MFDSIEDLYWSNVEFANSLYNVLDPLDYMIEKQERKDMIETLLGLPARELNALMFVSYEENNLTSLARSSGVSKFRATKTYNAGLNKLRRNLKVDHNWDLGNV